MTNDEISIIGVYPEVRIENIHYCMLDNCPHDKFQVLTSFVIEVPKENLGDMVCKLKFFDRKTSVIWNDDDQWEITFKKVVKTKP